MARGRSSLSLGRALSKPMWLDQLPVAARRWPDYQQFVPKPSRPGKSLRLRLSESCWLFATRNPVDAFESQRCDAFSATPFQTSTLSASASPIAVALARNLLRRALGLESVNVDNCDFMPLGPTQRSFWH